LPERERRTGSPALADIAEQHMIGWPTMMPPIERDAQRKALEIGREEALKAGAAN
jgi:ferrochelatase